MSQKQETNELNREYLEKIYADHLNLTYLDLSNERWKTIKADTFGSFKNLYRLELYKNQIETIEPDSFVGLSNLNELWLNGNRISLITSETFNGLIELAILNLGENQIELLEPSLFQSLSKLRKLLLNSNKLKRIDNQQFKSLTNLYKLSLHTNQIEVLESKAFEGISNLKELWLNGNKLNRINSNTFKLLSKLEILSLHTNQIEEVEPNSFEGLSNLKELWLNGNKLNRIHNDTFKSLTKLELLALENNQIEVLEPQLFENLFNLKELGLHQNKLSVLERSCFRNLKEIGLILLKNNNFDRNIVSFFNKKIFEARKSFKKFSYNFNMKPLSVSDFESFLSQNYSFISNLNDFLNQFHDSFPENSVQEISSSSPDSSNRITSFRQPLSGRQFVRAVSNSSSTTTPSFNTVVDNQSTNNVVQRIGSQLNTNNTLSNPSRIIVPVGDPYVGKTFKEFLILKSLGKGGFGQVYLVNDKLDKNHSKKAMKIMDFNDMAENETNILTRLNHENIVKYFNHFQVDIVGPNNKRIKLCIVTEFCEKGDLSGQIKEKKKKKENFKPLETFKWIFEAACGLKYLHSFQPQIIIHRDIKPENILLSKDSVIKLADMGLSRITNDTQRLYSIAGTREYISPEIYRCLLDKNQSYSFKTDIWSLGCVLYELMNLKKAFPFGQESNPPIPDLGSKRLFSPILKKFAEIIRMLEKNEDDRVDSNQLYKELLNVKEILEAFSVI